LTVSDIRASLDDESSVSRIQPPEVISESGYNYHLIDSQQKLPAIL